MTRRHAAPWFMALVLGSMLAVILIGIAGHTDPPCDQRVNDLARIYPEAAQTLASELVCTIQ